MITKTTTSPNKWTNKQGNSHQEEDWPGLLEPLCVPWHSRSFWVQWMKGTESDGQVTGGKRYLFSSWALCNHSSHLSRGCSSSGLQSSPLGSMGKHPREEQHGAPISPGEPQGQRESIVRCHENRRGMGQSCFAATPGTWPMSIQTPRSEGILR
jgi:hypothetical protein